MRALRRLLITLVVLCVLFVAADRIAVAVAESQVASRIQSTENLSAKPKVSIEGFPFLTQLLGHKLSEVKLSADTLALSDGSGSRVTLQSLQADLHDVTLSKGFSSATVQSGTGSALLSYADVSQAVGHGLTFSYGGTDPSDGAGRVKISGSTTAYGLQISGSGTADLRVLSGDSIATSDVSVGDLSGANLTLLPGLKTVVSHFFNTSFKVPNLPAGLSLKSVQAEKDGVLVELSGTDLKLTG